METLSSSIIGSTSRLKTGSPSQSCLLAVLQTGCMQKNMSLISGFTRAWALEVPHLSLHDPSSGKCFHQVPSGTLKL